MCGILLSGEFLLSNLITIVSNIPKQSVLPSCECLQRSCIPMHIPNTGCVSDFIISSILCCLRYAIAVEASPTPGKITLSAFIMISLSSVITASTPILCNAHFTEKTLPALYLIMTIPISRDILHYPSTEYNCFVFISEYFLLYMFLNRSR